MVLGEKLIIWEVTPGLKCDNCGYDEDVRMISSNGVVIKACSMCIEKMAEKLGIKEISKEYINNPDSIFVSD